MKDLIGRLIAYVFLGSFCIAGPSLLIFAVGVAAQRAALVIAGRHAEATVTGMQQMGSTRPTFAPVVQFTASDGRSYTFASDVYGNRSAVRYGQRVRVLYWPSRPQSARLDAFAALWTLPLVTGVVGAGFSVVPAIVFVAWLQRRVSKAEPQKQEAARVAADAVSRGFRRALAALLIGCGGVLLALKLGVGADDSTAGGSRILPMTLGVLLVACGVQVGQWVATGSRLYYVFGSVMVTSFAVMFGWVALYGDAASFHGAASIGGEAVALGNAAEPARILFAAVAVLSGLASLWSWKQVFRSSLNDG